MDKHTQAVYIPAGASSITTMTTTTCFYASWLEFPDDAIMMTSHHVMSAAPRELSAQSAPCFSTSRCSTDSDRPHRCRLPPSE